MFNFRDKSRINRQHHKQFHEMKSFMQTFMIGMPRSGTSVLSEAISTHEDFAWISNIVKWAPSFPRLSILNRATDVPVFGNLLRGKKKQQSGLVSMLRRVLPRSDEAYPVWDHLCGEYFSNSYLLDEILEDEQCSRARSYFSILCRAHGKPWLFAKFTGPPRIRYLTDIFPDARFVHVVRDPRAVISSLLNVDFWKTRGGFDKPWWDYGFGEEYERRWIDSGRDPVVLAALQWNRVEELTIIEGEGLTDDRIIHVRYEDFVEQPQEMLLYVFNKLGMAPSDRATEYMNTAGKLVNMNHKYKRALTEEQIKNIEQITGEYAQKWGYEF